jgi:hypothetical protein
MALGNELPLKSNYHVFIIFIMQFSSGSNISRRIRFYFAYARSYPASM